MPVINGEAAYEMLSDSLPTQWTRQMFWLCMTNGAAGHTYGANGIWQCNRRGEPHGKSPHGGDYGHIPWDEAMNLPGSQQLGFGKKLFEKFEWQKFTPHPEWATYAESDDSLKPKWAHWIWTPEGDPTIDAPVAKRYFRKAFELPPRDVSLHGMLWISADDRLAAYLNGKRIASHVGTGTFISIDVSSKLKPGRNVLAVEAENLRAPVAANPAGLLANLQVQTANGKARVIDSDASWRCANEVTADSKWTSIEFTDSTWKSAKELGPYGCKPWGTFAAATNYGPYSTGILDKARIVYVPQSFPVRVMHLKADAKYRVQAFDPTDGKLCDLGAVEPGAQSGGVIKKPASIQSDDWVVVIERIE
jgi:hypothetical protein